jgi:hypothetical protein
MVFGTEKKEAHKVKWRACEMVSNYENVKLLFPLRTKPLELALI